MPAQTPATDPRPAQGPDSVTALYAYDTARNMRSGAHPGKSYNATDKIAYKLPKYFEGETVTSSTTAAFHGAVSALAEAGGAFLVRGHLAHGRRYLRRTPNAIGTDLPGLADALVHALAVDCDSWPNIDGHDPRRDPVAAWRGMLSILGAEFASADVSAHWSSSCCVRTAANALPEKLDARFFVRLSVPVSSAGAGAILKMLNGRVLEHFADRGFLFVAGKRPVDPALANLNQPIYIATPRFAGIADPIPVRRLFLAGDRREVVLAGHWDGLPVVAPSVRPATVRADRTKRKVRVAEVIPLAAMARLVATKRAVLDQAIRGDAEAYKTACTNLFHRRICLEMLALAIYRGGLAGTGTSNDYSVMIASAYVASLPLGFTAERVRAEVRALLTSATGAEWLGDEWEGKGDKCIVDRYLRASAGERTAGGRDVRYTYGKARLVLEWAPSWQEVRDLGLVSLCADADRRAASRDDARTGPSRDAVTRAGHVRAPEAQALRSKGVTIRAIAAAMQLTIGRVYRLLEVKFHAVSVAPAVPAEASVRLTPVPVLPVVRAAPEANQVLDGAIRYAMAAGGLEGVEELAGAVGASVGAVSDALDRILRPEMVRRAA